MLKLLIVGLALAVSASPANACETEFFVQAPDGGRKITRVSDGYFRLVADWIRGPLRGYYGRARKR